MRSILLQLDGEQYVFDTDDRFRHLTAWFQERGVEMDKDWDQLSFRKVGSFTFNFEGAELSAVTSESAQIQTLRIQGPSFGSPGSLYFYFRGNARDLALGMAANPRPR